LIRLLMRDLQPTAGVVEVQCSIGYLPQQLTIGDGESVASLLGIAPQLAALKKVEVGECDEDSLDLIGDDWDLPDRARAELARLGLAQLDFARPAEHLSGGEVTRLVLARVLLARPEFL